MRGRFKYGVPIAAGLATGGYALSQGEDPGSAALAAGAGALGGAAGLLGARLAGKYMAPITGLSAGAVGVPIVGATLRALNKGSEGGLRQKMGAKLAEKAEKVVNNPQIKDLLLGNTEGTSFERNIQKGIAAAAVPASALAAGLGGVALGAIPGAVGVPGFQQGMAIDPESPGSSNTASAKYGVTPYASTQYYV
jgi:hypothetical protein